MSFAIPIPTGKSADEDKIISVETEFSKDSGLTDETVSITKLHRRIYKDLLRNIVDKDESGKIILERYNADADEKTGSLRETNNIRLMNVTRYTHKDGSILEIEIPSTSTINSTYIRCAVPDFLSYLKYKFS